MGRTKEKAAEAIEEWLGEPLWDFGAKSAGVGLSDTIIEIIKGQGWAAGVSDEILQAIVGLAARKYGDRLHDQIPNVGSGVLYQLVGRVVFKERIAPFFAEKLLKKSSVDAQLKKAFTSKYGKDPTTQQMNIMRRAYSQRQPIKQQVQTPPAGEIQYQFVR